MKNDVNRALVAKKKFCKISLTLLAGLLLTFAFPVQGWASSHSTHYGMVVAGKVTNAANGTVYVATSSTKPATETTSATWNCGGSSGSDTKTCYWWATPNDGYYCEGWYSAQAGTGSATKTTANFSESVTATGTSGSKATTKTYYAKFSPVDIAADNDANASNLSFKANAGSPNEKTFIFISEHASSAADFVGMAGVIFSGAAASECTCTDMIFEKATGKLSVVVSFLGVEGKLGEQTATVTVKGVGSEYNSASVTFTAMVSMAANFDAEVRKSDGTLATTTGSYTFSNGQANWATALAYANANAGCTIKLLRDVNLGALTANQAVSKTMTIDLNGYKLEATATSDKRIMNISGASTVVTIEDNAGGGKIVSTGNFNGTYYGIVVGAGKLVLNSGEIEVTNEKVYASGVTSMAVRGIHISSGANFTMNGGTLTTEGGNYVYAIYQANSATTNGEVHINGGTINAGCWRQYAYGLYGLGKMYVDGGTINAKTYTATGVSEAYGICVGSSANQTASAEYMGELFMTDGIVTAISQTSGAYAVGVLGGTTPGTKYTDDGTYYLTANRRAYPSQATISGGTFNATSTTSGAYGLYVMGSVRSVSDEYDHSMDKPTVVTGGTFNATATTSGAYGIYANAESSWAYACLRYGIVEVSNAVCNAHTGTSGAYGAYVNVNSKRWAEGATSTSWNASYPFRDRKDEYTVAAKMTIHSGTFTGTASTTSGCGVCVATRAIALSGDADNVAYPELTINGGTFVGKTEGSAATTTAYGLYSGGNTTVNGGTFTGLPKTTTGYGAYVNAGKTIINGGTFSTTATSKAYGVYVNAAVTDVTGVKTAGELEINNNPQFTVKSNGDEAYGIYLNAAQRTVAAGTEWNRHAGEYACAAKATVNGGNYRTQASGKTAYSIYPAATVFTTNEGASAAPEFTVSDGLFNVSGSTPVADVYGAVVHGKDVINGGYFVNGDGVSECTEAPYQIYKLDSKHDKYAAGYRYYVTDERPWGYPVCKNGTKEYLTLEAALEDVNNGTVNGGTIEMLVPYILPAGNYTIPNGVTLLVPYKENQGTAVGAKASTVNADASSNPASVKIPFSYRKLTLAPGAHIDVQSGGVIEASAQMWAKTGSKNSSNPMGTAAVYGPYGQIQLEEGSSISLQSNAKLQAWGYVTGKGEITAHRGATVYEMFQIMDWKGGNNILSNITIGNSQKVFHVNQYAIQNVEAPTIYRPGSRLTCSMYTTLSHSITGCDNVGIVGTYTQNGSSVSKENAMFLMESLTDDKDTWVRKEYDAEHDVQMFSVSSSAYLSSMSITVKVAISNQTINSANYDLPLTSNFKIVVDNGTLQITENTVMLPGAEIEVMHDATAVIASGKRLTLYDKDQWGKYAFSALYAQTVGYSPSWGKTSPRSTSLASLKDAAINVHGTIDVQGKLFTTAGGANIYSNDAEAGHVIFSSASAAPKDEKIYQWNSDGYTGADLTSAKLFNEDNSHTATEGAFNGKDFCYSEGRWQCWEKVGCFQVDKTDDANWKWYGQPSDFVQLKPNADNNQTAPVLDEDHLYPSADETRFFILLDDCMWREVSLVDDGLVYCEDKDTYYEWNDTQSQWEEKYFSVVWKNWDNSVLNTYNYVKYNTMPKWLSATPTKARQAGDPVGSYWNFTGWTPDFDYVKSNQEYTAVFELIVPKYDVLWKNEDGSKTLHISRWAEGEHPVYDGAEIKKATSMVGVDLAHNGWSTGANGTGTRYGLTDELPAMGTTAQTYYATFAEGYIITWKNENGDVLDSKLWATGTRPTHEEIIKESDEQYDYVFAGWTPEILPVEADAEYTAVFTPVLRQYAITFSNLNGKGSSQVVNVGYGATPVCPVTPDRGNSAEYSYEWTGWKDAAGNTYGTDYVFPAVSGDATYTATFSQTTRTYTVTWKNEDGSVLERVRGLATGDAVPDYSGATPEKEPTRYLTYGFAGWTPTKKATIDESGDQEYRATFDAGSTRYYTISWLMDNGDLIDETLLEYDQMPTHTDASKPSSSLYSYEFAGWTPAISEVKDDATYTAAFNAIHRQYTIVFQNEDGTLLQQSNMEQGVMPSYTGATPAKAADAQYTYTFNGWDKEIVTVSADATYTATYTQTKKSYTLTWNLAGGNITTAGTTAGSVEWGTSLTAPVVEKTGYTFAGWTPTVPATMPTENATYTAQWQAQQEVTYTVNHYYESALGVKEQKPFRTEEKQGKVGEQVSAEDVLDLDGYDSPAPSTQIIAAEGTVVDYYYKSRNLNVTDNVVIAGANLDQIVVENNGALSASAPSTTKRLVLTATPGNNDGANADLTNISISESVCIEIEMNNSGTMDDKLFYCFSVPFNVNVSGGVTRLNKNNGQWESAALNTNYRVYTYNEADRAINGRQDSNWKEFNGTQFLPGVFYLCEFDNSDYNRYRFYAAEGASLNNKGDIEVTRSSENEKDGGWNGVANNGLTDNQLSGDFTYIQTLNSEDNCFEAAEASKTPLAIGNAAMVQVYASGSVVVGETPSAVAARRMGEAASTEFINVRLYKENQNQHVDQIFIRASEDAAEQYVAGIDLSKATMGTPKVARMWVNDYDLQLVANEALMTNDQAIFSLGMSAPANGEYTIALDETPADAIVYLTMNGSAIWNLNIAPAPISLSKGTENSYGLRLVRKINNVVTGLDEAVLNGDVQKVILNDHLYIIRDGKVYSAHGHVIK